MARDKTTENPSARKPFFIASKNGGAVFSEHIVGLEPRNRGAETAVITRGNGEYAYTKNVAAPLAVVKSLMEDHGYGWVDEDELKTKAQAMGLSQGPE